MEQQLNQMIIISEQLQQTVEQQAQTIALLSSEKQELSTALQEQLSITLRQSDEIKRLNEEIGMLSESDITIKRNQELKRENQRLEAQNMDVKRRTQRLISAVEERWEQVEDYEQRAQQLAQKYAAQYREKLDEEYFAACCKLVAETNAEEDHTGKQTWTGQRISSFRKIFHIYIRKTERG